MQPRTFLPMTLAMALLASMPAQADDDRFTLRLGAMQADADISLRGAVDYEGQTYDYETSRMGFGDDTAPRVEGGFRFGNRHRLLFNYFQFDKDRRYMLDQEVSFGDTTFPAGSNARAEAQFDLASLVYDFALVETDTTGFGLQIGAEWAKLEGRAAAEAGEDRFEARDDADGVAPVVGARFSANTADQRWRFTLQGQYLDAGWGDFEDYDGDITRANALVEYRFTRNFGVFAGYDWFKLDVEKTFDATSRGALDLRFKGPTVGVTLAF